MAGLRLYTSNRMEILAQKLAELLRTPLSSPLEKEVIVVQSRGMERWVRMELARYHGICANVQFPFPNAIIQEIYSRVFKDLRDDPIYDPVIMTWKIMGLLPSCAKMPGFEAIRFYLEKRGNHLKWFQLSRRIADIFDQYLVYRPEMILDWEEGKENHWEALLWRKLVEGREKNHRAALKKTFLEMIRRRAVGAGSLPKRISIFGISTLPPYHMEIFGAISKLIEVNLFLMNPSKEYWADIVADKEIERFMKREGGDDALHLETGNSLLANMGALGRDFFVLVTGLESEEHECFEEAEARDMLSCIQSDILLLREPGRAAEDKRVVSQDDTSIQVHSCHSPLREMEVLYDSLLSMFEMNPDLEPRDIVVMMPDIEVYAPFIHAVFDIPGDDYKRIPFSIADRTVRSESRVAEAFLAILDLSGSRFCASEALSLLECDSIRQRFHLSEDDLPIIHRWVIETGIRWGIDARHREELGLQPQSENTWRFGLERLVLGYAMPGQEEKMFRGILPYDYVEGEEALLLGKFAEFGEALFSHAPGLGEARTLSEWSKSLIAILDRFFLPEGEDAREIHVIRDTIHSLTRDEELSGFHEEVELEVIKEFLLRDLEKQGFGFGFITGGVTFCAMLPMRSIPFKVICLAGMNNDAYPRQSKKLGFDLMAKHPKTGDRSRRKDDRYLFLEALLSARNTFYISYVGQSVQDNSYIPPSVMVSELFDYIEKAFTIPHKAITNHVLTSHRLQAFSPTYFRGEKKYRSYSEENFQAARRAVEERIPPKRFISKRLPEPSEEWKELDLGQLSSFFGNPARYLLRERLGIRLEMRSRRLNDIEPFEVEGLDKYVLEQMLVEKGTSGWDLKGFGAIAKSSGQLPHGTLGDCFYERIREGAEEFVDMVKAYTGERPLPALESKIRLAGCVLKARLGRVYPEGLIHYRYAKLKAKDHLGIWLPHLFLNCSVPTQYPRNSILLGKGEIWRYAPLDGSKEILEGLLEMYLEGLSKPLPFFPEVSLRYAEGLIEKGKSEEVGLVDAKKKWKGSDFSRGEVEDEYYKICFGETDPLDAEFQELAIEILAPLIQSRKRLLK
jgi:exodeoxyribonuclease V gamma subunit